MFQKIKENPIQRTLPLILVTSIRVKSLTAVKLFKELHSDRSIKQQLILKFTNLNDDEFIDELVPFIDLKNHPF